MEEKYLTCPYCLQAISVLLDKGVFGSNTIVDDCEVCCRPIEITYTVDNQEIVAFSYNTIEGNEF